MVDRDTAKTQLRKLGQIPYFTTVTDEAFSSWVSAMAKNAEDGAHAARAVSALLKTRTLPASPDDIRDALAATRMERKPSAAGEDGYCDRCRNIRPQGCIDPLPPPGWVMEVKLIGGRPYTFMGRCPRCRPDWHQTGSEN